MNFVDITIHTYLEILMEWIFEIYLIGFFTCYKMEKSDKFLLKYILGIVIIAAISYPISFIYYLIGNLVITRTIIYLILFALIVAHHFICYQEQKIKLLLFLDIVYIIQNLIYKIFSILYNSLLYLHAFGDYGPPNWLYKLIYYLTFFVLFVAAYYIFIKKIRKDLLDIQIPIFTIVISLATILIPNLLCSFIDIYYEKLIIGVTGDTLLNINMLKVCGDLFAIFVNILVIVMFFFYKKDVKQQNDINQLQYMIDQSEKQYQISQETIESINIKCHDMKHRIHQLIGSNLSKETIDELNESINIYDSFIKSGNKILDVILTEKSLLCDSRHITFIKMVNGKTINFLSEGDIFCLFGNIIDNAIEATRNIEDESKRYINLSLRETGQGIVEIECVNYYYSDIAFEDNLPKTIKEDKANHGFGMKSIKNIVNKYSGNMEITTENNIFTIHIILFNDLPNM